MFQNVAYRLSEYKTGKYTFLFLSSYSFFIGIKDELRLRYQTDSFFLMMIVVKALGKYSDCLREKFFRVVPKIAQPNLYVYPMNTGP